MLEFKVDTESMVYRLSDLNEAIAIAENQCKRTGFAKIEVLDKQTQEPHIIYIIIPGRYDYVWYEPTSYAAMEEMVNELS